MPDIVHKNKNKNKIFLIKGYERINTNHIILGLYHLNGQNVKNYEVYHILTNHWRSTERMALLTTY